MMRDAGHHDSVAAEVGDDHAGNPRPRPHLRLGLGLLHLAIGSVDGVAGGLGSAVVGKAAVGCCTAGDRWEVGHKDQDRRTVFG